MESKLALQICKSLLKWDIISKELEDIYIYGFELLFSFFSSTLIIITVGAILNKIVSSFVFLFVFISVRRFTGGFHAGTYLKCKIITVATYLLVLLFSVYINAALWSFILLGIIGSLIISKWGPIENPNKPLTEEDKRKHKITGLVFFEALLICSYAIKSLSQTLSNVTFYSLFSIIALMLYAIIKERSINNEKDR